MYVERFFRSGNESRVVGKAKIIVRAHVEHAFAAGDRNVSGLRSCDDAFGFKETLRFNVLQCLRKLFFEFRAHRWIADYSPAIGRATSGVAERGCLYDAGNRVSV